MRSLKRSVTPGINGLNTEFYQFFWQKLGNLYFSALQFAINNEKIHVSARRGVVTLIPKRDKDPLFLKNWRPLTMLNTDYKILAKLLAKRIKEVLPSLIDENQTGFMEGRQISKTIRTSIDVAKLKKQKNHRIYPITGF